MPGIDTTENYYRFRVRPPSKYTRFRIVQAKNKKGIKFIIGFKEGGGSEIQSILISREKYNREKAKKIARNIASAQGVTLKV